MRESDSEKIDWDINKQHKIFTFSDHIGEVFQVNFSSNFQLLVSAGQDNTIRVWDLQKGISLKIFQVYESQITAVKFSSDNEKVINSDRKGNLYIWSLTQPQPIAQWQEHFQGVQDIDISMDGKILATVDRDNLVKLWQIESLDDLINKSCNKLSDFINNSSSNYDGLNDENLCQNKTKN